MRTWGRKGQTPVLQETFGWESLSLIAGLTWKGFLFRLHAGSIQSEQVVAFLQVLLRHLSGPLLVVWDGAPIHRSARVRDFAAGTVGRLVLERLPAYAPELNPVEYLWGHLKEHELGNLLVRHAHELGHHATAALRRLRRRPKIIAACWTQSSLNL